MYIHCGNNVSIIVFVAIKEMAKYEEGVNFRTE